MISFPHYPKRRSISLDGIWDFSWFGDLPMKKLNPATMNFTGTAVIPGVFDASGPYCGTRGVGVYRKKIILPFPGGTSCRLDIGALGLRGKAWWDGKILGDIGIPYSRASFELIVEKEGHNELIIAVDNRFDPVLSPLFPPFSDFYAYGGIYRNISVSELPALRINRTTVTTLDLKSGLVNLKISFEGNVPTSIPLAITVDEGSPEKLVCRSKNGIVEIERCVPRAKPWSPENPELHTVKIEIDGDCIIERFGLRIIQTKNGKILLNGKPIRLMGVNRHESHPQFGPTQPLQLILDDLLMIKELGCNFIRAVHYPQTPEFLDLCDQLGLMVWEESLAWGLGENELLSKNAFGQLMGQTRQMVREGINHPSIIIWAFLNECASDLNKTEQVYAKLAKMIRSEDPTRLVSYASNRADRDRCFKYCDVVSCNLYPGWCCPTDWTKNSVSTIRPFVRQIADGLSKRKDIKGKPMLLSEIGACGLYGCRDRIRAQWSEEFQSDYMSEACRTALSDPRWSGVTLWQFCDSRSYVNIGEVRCKPRGFNCAGLVDEYRRPKLAYAAIQEIFKQ